MNKTTEALKLAEEALEDAYRRDEHAAARWVYEQAIAAIREAQAEPVKQEPVAWLCRRYNGTHYYLEHDPTETEKYHGFPLSTPLYAAPLDTKAIRAEALEEAANVCGQGTGDAIQTETLKLLLQERWRIASVIRGLK